MAKNKIMPKKEVKENFIVFSDVHGRIEAINKIKNTRKDSDHLVFLGDMFDREKRKSLRNIIGFNTSFEVLDFMFSEIAKDKMTFIMGNHDEMLFTILGFIEPKDQHDREWLRNIFSAHANKLERTLKILFPSSYKATNQLSEVLESCLKNWQNAKTREERVKIYFYLKDSVENYTVIIKENKKNKGVLDKLEYIFKNSHMYYVCEELGVTFTHSGSKTSTWENASKLPQTEDVIFTGHAPLVYKQTIKLVDKDTFTVSTAANNIFSIDEKNFNNVAYLNKATVEKIINNIPVID